MKKLYAILSVVLVLALLCCPLTVFASAQEEFVIPEPTWEDYLYFGGSFMGSMVVGMVGCWLYYKIKRKIMKSRKEKNNKPPKD